MDAEDTISMLAAVIERRGYLVLNSGRPYEIGDIFSHGFVVIDRNNGKKLGEIDQPFRVMRETDRPDWDEQLALMATFDPGAASPDRPGRFFYRIVTD